MTQVRYLAVCLTFNQVLYYCKVFDTTFAEIYGSYRNGGIWELMWHNKSGALHGREVNKVSRSWTGRNMYRTFAGKHKEKKSYRNPQEKLRCHDEEYIWLNLFSNMRTWGIWAIKPWCFGKGKILYYWRGLGGCETVESYRWIRFRGGPVPHKCLYLPPPSWRNSP